MNVVPIVQPDPLPDFADFWLLYPRRVAKKDAAKVWARLTAEQQVAALVACVAWRVTWSRKDVEYLPYPASWLNGERWEDELPASNVPAHASHVIAAPGPEYQKTTMPEHVRALLAKLRGKG